MTTLLAGSVGQLLGVEIALGFRGHCSGQKPLERRYLAGALHGDDPFSDRACFLAFMWLDHEDDGDTDSTVCRLWWRANDLLRQEDHRRGLDRLAAALMQNREMYKPEISRCLD